MRKYFSYNNNNMSEFIINENYAFEIFNFAIFFLIIMRVNILYAQTHAHSFI